MTGKKFTISFSLAYLSFFIIFAGLNRTASASLIGQQDKPVEQTRPNIQVLKGLPESQLMITMNFIRASLGVNCAYCHVNAGGDKWEWAKDDKPAKQIARRHIQMTFDINKASFGGQAVVTCNTCHQGKAQPAQLPFLPQTPPEGGAAGERPAVILPTASQILDRYVQALGGQPALEKLQTRVMRGSHVTWNGTTMPVEIYQAAPNKLLSTLTSPRGLVSQGFDGTSGWFKGPRGQRELIGDELAETKRAAEFHHALRLKELSTTMKVVGKEMVGEREAYLIEFPIEAKKIARLYFDTQTGLLVRAVTLTQSLIGPIPEQTDFEDYRDVDGVKVPFLIRESYVDPWIGWTRRFTDIKHNVPVAASVFNRPEAQK